MKKLSMLFVIGLVSFVEVAGQNLIPYYEVVSERKSGNVHNTGRWGYKNDKGRRIIEPIYYKAEVFKNGFAKVEKDFKIGVINENGKEVIPCMFTEMGKIVDGMVSVTLEGRGHALIDMEQNVYVPFLTYGKIEDGSEGFTPVKSGSEWGFVNKSGKEKIKTKYDEVKNFHEGFARVKLKDKYGFIDKSGKIAIPIEYEQAGMHAEGLFRVKVGNKWGYLNKSNKIVIPSDFEYASEFSAGIALVGKDGKYGYIDKNGSQVIPCTYDDLNEFRCGLAKAKLGNRTFFIDKQGIEKFAPGYDEVRDFSDSLAVVKEDNKYGYINTQGQEIFPPYFNYAANLEGGLGYVELKVEDRTLKGYIDNKGKRHFEMPDFAAERREREERRAREKDLASFIAGHYNKITVNDGSKNYKSDAGQFGDRFEIERVSDTRIIVNIYIKTRDEFSILDSTRSFTVQLQMDVSYGDLPIDYKIGKDQQGFKLSLPPNYNPESVITSAIGYYRPLDNEISLYITSKKLSVYIDAKRDYSHN